MRFAVPHGTWILSPENPMRAIWHLERKQIPVSQPCEVQPSEAHSSSPELSQHACDLAPLCQTSCTDQKLMKHEKWQGHFYFGHLRFIMWRHVADNRQRISFELPCLFLSYDLVAVHLHRLSLSLSLSVMNFDWIKLRSEYALLTFDVIFPLTHWGRDKMATTLADDIFKCIFLNENMLVNFD